MPRLLTHNFATPKIQDTEEAIKSIKALKSLTTLKVQNTQTIVGSERPSIENTNTKEVVW